LFIGNGLNAVIGEMSPGATERNSLLSSGAEAQVSAGSEVATQLLRPVTLNTRGDGQGGASDRVVYTSANMIRGAQAALRERNYYRGQIDGNLGGQTRQALANFQNDNGQPTTGDLDQATASLLGLVRVGETPSWYEQAIRNAPNDEAATVAARILVRSGLKATFRMPAKTSSSEMCGPASSRT
jgi:peptidoglycan hydrolase-like protein with peptidoglycan-binding domain